MKYNKDITKSEKKKIDVKNEITNINVDNLTIKVTNNQNKEKHKSIISFLEKMLELIIAKINK